MEGTRFPSDNKVVRLNMKRRNTSLLAALSLAVLSTTVMADENRNYKDFMKIPERFTAGNVGYVPPNVVLLIDTSSGMKNNASEGWKIPCGGTEGGKYAALLTAADIFVGEPWGAYCPDTNYYINLAGGGYGSRFYFTPMLFGKKDVPYWDLKGFSKPTFVREKPDQSITADKYKYIFDSRHGNSNSFQVYMKDSNGAVFDPKYWPQAFGLQKIQKSKGPDAYFDYSEKEWGVDIIGSIGGGGFALEPRKNRFTALRTGTRFSIATRPTNGTAAHQ